MAVVVYQILASCVLFPLLPLLVTGTAVPNQHSVSIGLDTWIAASLCRALTFISSHGHLPSERSKQHITPYHLDSPALLKDGSSCMWWGEGPASCM